MSLFEVWDLLKFLKKQKDKHLAVMLDELEIILPPENSEKEFQLIRKLILDHLNDYHRAVYRVVLGIEVEGQDYL
jgi:hypothetical protein